MLFAEPAIHIDPARPVKINNLSAIEIASNNVTIPVSVPIMYDAARQTEAD